MHSLSEQRSQLSILLKHFLLLTSIGKKPVSSLHLALWNLKARFAVESINDPRISRQKTETRIKFSIRVSLILH